MKCRKRTVSLASALLCLATLICVAAICSYADSGKKIYAEVSGAVEQGSYGYCYVYSDDLTDLASASISVMYDSDVIEITSYYNSLNAKMYDASSSDGELKYSYILSPASEASRTRLFYFRYRVKESAVVGKHTFDIVVYDTYASDRSPLDYSGSRCTYEVKEKPAARRCSVYSYSSISTSVLQEFELSYRLSVYDVAAGAFDILYDPEFFAFSSLTCGDMLLPDENLLVSANTANAGSISVSFAGVRQKSSNELITVRFKTKKNVDTVSEIEFRSKGFYDADRVQVICGGYKTKVSVNFDDEYTGDAPKLWLGSQYSSDGDIELIAKLDAASRLGAGDFTIKFDPESLDYKSYETGFSPDYFGVNDKKASEGIIKFSILSLSDITDAQTVLKLKFSPRARCENTSVRVDITASGLSDSLTNKILLNLIGTSVNIEGGNHTKGIAQSNANDHWYNCTLCGTKFGETAHSDTNKDLACDVCGHAMMRINSASLSLAENIEVNYYVTVPDGFTDPYMVFEFNSKEFLVNKHTTDSSGELKFVFQNVYPQMLGNNISATLWGYSVNDGEWASVTIANYSVRQYCINVLRSTTDESLKTLISDLLVYAEKTQLYRNYKTDALVTEDISISPSKFEALDKSYNRFLLTGENDVNVRYSSVSLLLKSDMTLKLGITTNDPSPYTFVIKNGSKEYTYTSEDLYYDDGRYYLEFTGIMAVQFDNTIVATIRRGNTQVGQTLTYSVNSYIQKYQNHTDESLRDLLRAIFNYGRSAYAYKYKKG